MARSRSKSRDRSRRKYSSSDESDYDRRKRSSKKKRRSSRSRSRSTDSDRRKYRSREDSRYQSSSRSDRRESKHKSKRRDRSRDRSPSDRSRREREGGRTERAGTRDQSGKGTTDRAREVRENMSAREDPGLSLKERVAKLVSSSNEIPLDKTGMETEYKIDSEKVAEIDSQGFHQQAFVSNAIERDGNKNFNGKSATDNSGLSEHDNHADAIFGSSLNTVSSTLTKSNGSNILNQDADDDIFGPSLLIDQRIRTERWLDKLKSIRQRVLQQSI